MAVSCLLLGLFTPNLAILWSLARTLWLCESIVANLIIYRPVPSPSPFESRKFILMWGTNHVHRNCLKLNCVSPKYNKPYLGEVCRSQPDICVFVLARFNLSPSSLSHNFVLRKVERTGQRREHSTPNSASSRISIRWIVSSNNKPLSPLPLYL